MTPAVIEPVWMPMRAQTFRPEASARAGEGYGHARDLGNAAYVVGLSFGNSGSAGVGVANGLDLFHTVFHGVLSNAKKILLRKSMAMAGHRDQALSVVNRRDRRTKMVASATLSAMTISPTACD